MFSGYCKIKYQIKRYEENKNIINNDDVLLATQKHNKSYSREMAENQVQKPFLDHFHVIFCTNLEYHHRRNGINVFGFESMCAQ